MTSTSDSASVGEPDTGALLRTWLGRARESQFAHYAAATRLAALHYIVGVPTSIAAAVVGTSVFASLDTAVSATAKTIVGGISVPAAILAGLQTFWRFSERAERHCVTAGEYARIRRDIEQHLIFLDRANYCAVASIRKALDDIAAKAPTVGKLDWSSGKKAADNKYFLSGQNGGQQ